MRNPAEFRRVYDGGRRIDGRLMTAFVLPNGLEHHRFGITASRKMSRLAVKRNRAKRLLREAFRLTACELDGLSRRYDWVFNARRSIIEEKVGAVISDLQRIIAQVKSKEEAACETEK